MFADVRAVNVTVRLPTVAPIAPAVSAVATSVTVGASGAPAAGADDLEALLDHLAIERALLVCQSMGGWAGLELALRRPARVQGLVMACTSGTVDYRALQGLDRHALEAWSTRAAHAARDLPREGSSLPAGTRMAREQPALHQLYAGLSSLTEPGVREQARHEIHRLRNRSPEILAGLTMPVLYLEGEEDLVFPPLAGPALASATPEGFCMSVPAAGHSVYFERAAAFNAIVGEFVAARVFSDRTQDT